MKVPAPTSDPVINLVMDTLTLGKQALVFANTKNSAEKQAEEISKKLNSRNPAYTTLSKKILQAVPSPTKQCKRLASCIEKGVAFHHAGLTWTQREIVEDSFKNRIIRTICATTTLGAGLDLPAYRVIIKDLRRYGSRGLQYIPILEYHQMAGRAGRPSFDDKGESIVIVASEDVKEEIISKYIQGKPEDIYSKLAVEPVLRTYVLSLIATGFARSKKDLFAFFSRTFWAFQYKDHQELESTISRMIDLLISWDFINSSAPKRDEFTSAYELNMDEKYSTTILGKRISQLYLDPYTASQIVEALKKITKIRLEVFSFLQLFSSTLELRPQLRAGLKDQEKIDRALIEHSGALFFAEPSYFDDEYAQFTSSVKTALFFNDWIEEHDEEYLLKEYKVRPGEIMGKLDLADWLCYCTEEIARILRMRKVQTTLKKLRIRLKYGTKEELLALLRFKGIGRKRARVLFNNRIRDAHDIRTTSIQTLGQLVGKGSAQSLKEQIGEIKPKPKENKRKGQISLNDW